MFVIAIVAKAAPSVGEWTIYPRFMGTVTDIVDTPEKVYYTSGNRLFSYDKESNETYFYSTQNRLNDINVDIISYNPERKCLFVGYDNGNIDLLYDNGKVVNMSDIKDAAIMSDKTINNVTFRDGRAYLATKFGFVILDVVRHEVVESAIFNQPVQCLDLYGDWLMMQQSEGASAMFYAPISSPHNTRDKFTYLSDTRVGFFRVFGDYMVYSDMNNNNAIHRMKMRTTVDGRWIAVSDDELLNINGATGFKAGNDGYYLVSSTQIVRLDNNDGSVAERIDIPTSLKGQLLSAWKGPKAVWGADADGVACYNIDGGNVTLLADKAKPEGVSTDEVFFQKWDSKGRLWTGNLGPTMFRAGRNGDYIWLWQRVSRLTDDRPEDMSLLKATVIDPSCKYEQQSWKHTRLVGGVAELAIDPFNPDRYYQAANVEGLYVIENNEQIHVFNQNNSPFRGAWGARVIGVTVDHENNLWVGCDNEGKSAHTWYVLPAEKLRGDITAVTPSDWHGTKFDDNGNKDMGIVVCRKTPAIFSFNSTWGAPLRGLRTNGTLTNTTDDELFDFTGILDQDGKPYEPDRWACGVEDRRGRVWFGTTMGVVEITNPRELNANTRLNRIKVPRNDGTNFADYLCETDIVYDIAVDNSNRKWIATDASGVFLVSENGDRIIEHFTKDNSPLPDNCVLSVSCDPNSNKVYFGLLSGLVSYTSDSSPAAEDFSDVYAYPNPVRPDYTGPITITNLMDNSLVKIADAAGHVFYQGRSEGGMITWNGLDATGNRVRSGVYFVYASSNNDGSSASAVTKIVVVN